MGNSHSKNRRHISGEIAELNLCDSVLRPTWIKKSNGYSPRLVIFQDIVILQTLPPPKKRREENAETKGSKPNTKRCKRSWSGANEAAQQAVFTYGTNSNDSKFHEYFCQKKQ